MQNLSAVPKIENELEIYQRIEFELEVQGYPIKVGYDFMISVNFKPKKKEIIIECIEDHSIPETWE